MKIFIVDAFTNQPFKGNPAGVCLVGEFPSIELMQNMALELACTNSAFVKRLASNHYHIRWFTPVSEAPLCGHATIATMHILNEMGAIKKDEDIIFESMSGTLTATASGTWYSINFPLYPVKTVPLTQDLRDIVNYDPLYTGFSHNCYLMEFEDRAQLAKLVPNLELLKKVDCRALIATARGIEYDFHSRYFAPRVGINEDPVCASAHCRLIPYWSQKLGKDEMTSYQLSARGGILKCKNLGNRVLISGEAVTVMVSNFVG